MLSPTVLSALARTTARVTARALSPHASNRRAGLSASASTGHRYAPPVPARSRTSAADAGLPATPSSTVLVVSQEPVRDTRAPATPATEARDKVHLLATNSNLHPVSTPINVDILERELSHHLDPNFAHDLISALRYGAHVGYTGPRKPRVSRNLVSAIQHPEVVSSNLNKEIQLGRVAGPFDSSPIPDLQCHLVGVVPKKHSSEWRTIYHLSYPEGDSINNHIPKDPYALQYVWVDDAIRILQSLGLGCFYDKNRP